MGKAVVIVQARMTSTRLPGKVLLDLAGHSVLEHVLLRCRAIRGADQICCAIPQAPIHDALLPVIARAGATVFRGSEDDVLDRYQRAAQALKADVVMRVTSDCPLIDPNVCADVLALVAGQGYDYACNNMPSGWPHGLDCEAFTYTALELAASSAAQAAEREHVTPWLRNSGAIRKANLPGSGGAAAEQRWTLDFPEDYQFFASLFQHLPAWPTIPSTAEVMAVLARHPEIEKINLRHHGTSRPTIIDARKDSQ